MIKQMIKHLYNLAQQSYEENKYRQYLREKLKQRKVILVHQMGKVASTSLVKSLEKLNLDSAVCQTHYLQEKSVDDVLKKYKAQKLPLQNYIIASQEISKFIETTSPDYPWKIITVVREPIHRNISAFFENLDNAKQSNLYIPNFVNQYQSELLELDSVINQFLENYPHSIPLRWFDEEIKDIFSIDVYSWKFPQETGYQVIKYENLELLILRLENMSNIVQPAVSEFLGIDNFQLNKKNQAKQKAYFEVYSDFLNSIILPQSYIDKMYSSKYMKHFYSQNEIDMFRKKWSKNG